jgi:protein-tyrosine-phosphatase
MTTRVLFLCTGNSARSILAECLLNRLGHGRFQALSAGSRPTGAVHPLALELLDREGFDTATLRSKSWDEFANAGAAPIDLVVTVCDAAAGEACPLFDGAPIRAHWGIPDPAACTGDDRQKRKAFRKAYRQLERRITEFVDLPFDALDDTTLTSTLDRIGKLAE